ncbi:hypothetical protein ASPZODRAFT_12188 [Penicilliopsis zonata CBS 506.65]|uniref:BZIP domain-containing protein n=1 Tax=Penicilliopsis zonata CBS 506.65 TaxID=1073090 RepID=A0A1L9SW38_9EURO|nr:hypothetical protein ASPZODRAFT_12188 [Penicilliopsis zonata CBS 506.65]OJJ51354.1 hypothetical protein ASPZODRAFT_12188 [Penicilliopsis zonata CBS 506.65]
MDYSYYPHPPPQPFSLYGLSTAGRNGSADDFQETFSMANNFQDNYAYNSVRLGPPTGFVPPHSPSGSFSKQIFSSPPGESTAANSRHELLRTITQPPAPMESGEDGFGERMLTRSSSEEKEILTPAQNRRKAQNRAAQRAFRERKERHVRELEQKVSNLEQVSNSLQADNERLKRELARFATENEILRATTTTTSNASDSSSSSSPPISGSLVDSASSTDPIQFTPATFCTTLMLDGSTGNRPHKITVCEATGEKLLDVGATWNLIQAHDLFRRGLVDIGALCERLRNTARCDGQGPAFKESQLRQLIEECALGGSDELI